MRHDAVAAKFLTVAPNVLVGPGFRTCFFALLAAKNFFRWLLDFWKICALCLSTCYYYEIFSVFLLMQLCLKTVSSP